MNNYTTELFEFLRQLQQNNNRTWFNARKVQYESLKLAFVADVQRLIGQMSEYDETLRGTDARNCIYRIYRDIRFSPNKDPYKCYFSAVIAAGGRKTQHSCYYLHLQPDACGLHGGMWCPDKTVLHDLRALISAEGDELLQIMSAPDFHFELCGEKLKKLPKDFLGEQNFPELIKMKEYLFSHNVSEQYFTHCDDWTKKVAQDFKPLKTVNDFLNYVFT